MTEASKQVLLFKLDLKMGLYNDIRTQISGCVSLCHIQIFTNAFSIFKSESYYSDLTWSVCVDTPPVPAVKEHFTGFLSKARRRKNIKVPHHHHPPPPTHSQFTPTAYTYARTTPAPPSDKRLCKHLLQILPA